ncbi:MAG: hypothetical protein FK733_16270 [Asgard group archaeon]|nr:hypothetical protein [Asgard group archaeon]
MKPTNLCLVQMGASGLEVIDTYPNTLPNEVLRELAYKSMPLTAKPGDFASATMNEYSLSSYIFEVPQQDKRNNIASLVAVYSTMEYNPTEVKKAFTVIVEELNKKDLLKMEVIKSILPNLQTGLSNRYFTMNISSQARISFDFRSDDEKDVKTLDKRAENVSDDLWR